MSWFAKKCKSIRLSVLRFLIDMLNDEIDEIRIGSLQGIALFNEILKLNDNAELNSFDIKHQQKIFESRF